MRFVVVGPGAIGGVIAGRLAEHGFDVLAVARGAHFEAIRDHGLTVESPDGATTTRIPVVDRVEAVDWTPDDVAILAMKGQDTVGVLEGLERSSAPTDLPIVCAQNGVANEREALRRFPHVYGICVMCPATHIDPGVVQANSTPIAGLLDIGRFPRGLDDITRQIAEAFNASTFQSRAVPEIMRWKYCKLIMNLGNAIEALAGSAGRAGDLYAMAAREAITCFRAANIDVASKEEDRERRGDLLQIKPIAGATRGGGSSWQSLARGTRRIEVDYLNGEIVLLGRLHGIETPVNAALQQLAREAAASGAEPGSMPVEELLAHFPAAND